MVVNVTTIPNSATPSKYREIMQKIEKEFARRSGLKLTITTTQTGEEIHTIQVLYDHLNGPLRTYQGWNSSEFYPTEFSEPDTSLIPGTDITVQQADVIISKLLEICDVTGAAKIPKYVNGVESRTSISSTLVNARNTAVIPQLFSESVINALLDQLGRESYTRKTTSCRSACTGLCLGACATSCESICGSGCSGNCTAACGGSCDTACTSTCSENCSENCSNSCTNACSSGCQDSCSSNCNDGCKTSCTGNCVTTCSSACTKTCESTCISTCGGTCSKGCQADCNTTCSGCSANCGPSCGATCSGGCYTSCSTGCLTNCTSRCSASCGDSCISGCGKQCGTTCTGSCMGASNAQAPVDNTYVTPSGRDK